MGNFAFNNELTLTGPFRAPRQMLADQEYDGHTSVHDDALPTSWVCLAHPLKGQLISVSLTQSVLRCGAVHGLNTAALVLILKTW